MAARRTRQISLKECYEILHLEKGATLEDVKKSYRKRAFELHPDLNPGNLEAGRQFQLLNEAYVALSAMLKSREDAAKATQRPTAEQKAEKKQAEAKKEEQNARPDSGQQKASAAYAEQDVLRDLLNDPFARRVFEDIYSELNKKEESPRQEVTPPPPPPKREKNVRKAVPITSEKPPKITVPLWEKGQGKGIKGLVKDLLRRQIDDEQTLRLPAARLAPGKKIRLSIRRGMSDELHSIEVTLPSDFTVGKPVRLRGLGRRVGPWQGDLYLTINPD